MNAMSEQSIHAATAALATMLYQEPDRLVTPEAAESAYHGQYVEGLSKPLEKQSEGGALSRLLRGLTEWVARFRERRAVISELSRMSDRDLADIGLDRAQIHRVFDPAFVRARDTPYRATGDIEDWALADLGLSPTLPRPTTSR